MTAVATHTPAPNDTLRRRWRALPRLVSLLWQIGRRDVLVLLALSVVTGLLPLASLVLLRHLIDSAVGLVQGTASFGTAALWLGGFLLATLLWDGADVTSEWLGNDVQERLKVRVQGQLLAKASRLALADFEGSDAFDQLHRAQQGLDTRLFSTIQNLVPIPSGLVTIGSLLVFLGGASVYFPLVLLAGTLPAAFAQVRFFRRRYELDRAQTAPQRTLAYLNTMLVERPAAAEIRLFGLREHFIGRWQKAFRGLRGQRLRLAAGQTRQMTVNALVDKLTLGLVVAGAVALIALGRLSLGTFAAFLAAVDAFTTAVYLVFWNISQTDGDLRYIGDLLAYLDRPEEASATLAPTAISDVTVPRAAPEIRLEGVRFAYESAGQPVLDGIDLLIRPGERIALIGENGAGKTTLAKLVLGLYRPTAGRVLVDGVDLATLAPAEWRARVAAVLQDFVRYEVTARENIGFGDLARMRDDGAVQEAARRSGADAIIARLAEGYDTPLGKSFDENGHDLSGGQWQALAIARAELRDAGLVVLDEPAAALDARAEVEVYRRFRDAARGRTTLLIAHRLGVARLADRIVVLHRGRIVEMGTHEELVALGGHYATMYRVQAEWYR